MGTEHLYSLTEQHLTSLLEHALKTKYKTKDGDREDDNILKSCIQLFSKDYQYSLLNNSNGELCGHYPSQLVIQEYLKSDDSLQDNVESVYNITRLRELVMQAKFARCRSRFVVPVILYEGKHICRSATISGGAEMYGRQFYDFFTGGSTDANNAAVPEVYSGASSDMQIFDRVRGHDIRLLKQYNVGFILDLMLEQKKVKFGMNVTSSEKVDKENRYGEFAIASIPYPGCEFFSEWKNNGYRAGGLMFDWSQGFVDTKLDLPPTPAPPSFIDWQKYQNWDLVTLTQNYMKLMLHYVREADSGILLHCISGWDRTPMFISLIRLSLWADGVIHPSLSALEILYLTIGYDWFLFGHHFPDRLSRGEEVFFFCFTFLKYLTSEDFSISHRPGKRTADSADLFDGVLLDGASGSRCGSNSSISSGGSLNSTRSSSDHLQLPFCVNVDAASLTDDDCTPFNTMQSSSSTLRYSSTSRQSTLIDSPTSHDSAPHGQTSRQSSRDRNSPVVCRGRCSPAGGMKSSRSSSPRNAATTTTTTAVSGVVISSCSSPVPVPRPVQRLSNDFKVESVASCGSWQLVPGLDSLRCTPSSGSSQPSLTSENNNSSRSHSGSSSNEVPGETVRRQRLDEVRHLFVKLYCAVIGSCGAATSSDGVPSSNGSGGRLFSGLFVNFAEKVGVRPARSNFY